MCQDVNSLGEKEKRRKPHSFLPERWKRKKIASVVWREKIQCIFSITGAPSQSFRFSLSNTFDLPMHLDSTHS